MTAQTLAKPATAQEKYEARFAEFARADGVKFATPEAERSYREHVQMFKDVVQLKKPKRVPVCPIVGFYPFAYAGVTPEEAMYDYDKLAFALKKFHADFLPDSLAVAPIYGCGKALDVLDYKLYRCPAAGCRRRRPISASRPSTCAPTSTTRSSPIPPAISCASISRASSGRSTPGR